jgi:hypothetical protein
MTSPIAATAAKLYVTVNNAPGTGKLWTFTLMVNGSATALTCTISAAATTCSDTSHAVAIVAGNTLSIQITSTAPGGATQMRFAMGFS